MKPNRFLSAVLAGTLAVGLTACGSTAPASSGAESEPEVVISSAVDSEQAASTAAAAGSDPAVTLVFAESGTQDSTTGKVASYFKEKAEELSGGSVTIDLNFAGVLGSEAEVFSALGAEDGGVDLARLSTSLLSEHGCDKNALLTVPYTFASRAHWWNFITSDVGAQVLGEPQEIGLPFRGLFFVEDGFRDFFTVRSVTGLQDFKGLRLCVADSAITGGIVESLGAVVSDAPAEDLYTALQTGQADGGELSLNSYAVGGYNQVANTLILDGHTLSSSQVVMRSASWDALTENQRTALTQAGTLAEEYNAQISQQEEDRVLDNLRSQGCNIVEVPDKSDWAVACSNVVEQYTKDQPELYAQILDLA